MNRTLLAIPLFFMILLSLPQSMSDRIRSEVVSLFTPIWKAKPTTHSRELEALQLENFQLRNQLDRVYDWVAGEKHLRDEIELFRALGKVAPTEFLKRRADMMQTLLQSQTMASAARIIYRDPSSWSSCCWIDVGEENNQALGKSIIAKNSPVVSGMALVGVVEYVGRKQSRVRLITDSGVKTAVRAARGSILEREIALSTKMLISRLAKHSKFKESALLHELNQLHESLPIHFQDGFFAKGEVLGSSEPFQRVLSGKLKGIGFNCDVGDEEGPARNLRDESVLKPGDLLVTSGLDGVFPPGLNVAYVSKVEPLRQGAFAYDLEAEPAAGAMNDLTALYVLPPQPTD